MVALISVSNSSSPAKIIVLKLFLKKIFESDGLKSIWRTSDGKLKMSGGDSLHLQVLGGVASQLEDLSSEVLQDSRAVDCSGGSNTSSGEASALQMTMDSEKYILY